MSIMNEFKTFALRGNMVDLAIGVIIGAAFGKVVSSFVADVIMPPLGMLINGVDFSSLGITLKEASGNAPAVKISYGVFINAVVDFLIVAFVIFCVVKFMNSLKREKKPPEATQMDCPECLMPIPVKAKKCGHCGSLISTSTL